MITGAYLRARKTLQTATPLDLATTLTTLLVAFHGFKIWFVRLPSQALVVLGLIFRTWLSHPLFWLLLALLAGARIVYLWQDVDNHKYILFYWLCLLALAHALSDDALKQKLVLTNARFFLVFIMLGAAAQKLVSPSYMDSSFFELALLTDGRFRGLTALFGIDPGPALQAREFLGWFKSPYVTVQGNAIVLPTPPALSALASFVTWYDLIIQIVIGAAFLLGRRAGDLVGHTALLLFIFTAYFAAPVIGFAWALIIFGVLLAKDRFPNLAMLYVLALVATTLYRVPWKGWVT